MKLGYVRVSTEEQNTARQEVLMEQLVVDVVYVDKISGKNTDRPELTRLMNFVREGDIVIVESISRFARNTRDLLDLIEQLHSKNVQFISQKENIDTHTPTGIFMLTVFGAVAELEREYIRQRQREGIDIARTEGKYKGRRPKRLDDFEAVYIQWKSNTISAVKASKLLNISRSSFCRKVNEYESSKQLNSKNTINNV